MSQEWLPPEACINCSGTGVLNMALGENDATVWVPPYPCPVCNRTGLAFGRVEDVPKGVQAEGPVFKTPSDSANSTLSTPLSGNIRAFTVRPGHEPEERACRTVGNRVIVPVITPQLLKRVERLHERAERLVDKFDEATRELAAALSAMRPEGHPEGWVLITEPKAKVAK